MMSLRSDPLVSLGRKGEKKAEKGMCVLPESGSVREIVHRQSYEGRTRMELVFGGLKCCHSLSSNSFKKSC